MQQSEEKPWVLGMEDLPEDDEAISISHIIHVLWMRRYPFLAVFGVVFIVAIIQISQLTPRYTARAALVIGVPKSQIVNVEEVLAGDLNKYGATMTQVEVLKSRGLAKKVIEKYDLLNFEEFNPSLTTPSPSLFSFLNPLNWISAEFKQDIKEALGMTSTTTLQVDLNEEEKKQKLLVRAANIYSGKLKAEPVKQSFVVKVMFESTDPKMAAKVANAHVETYIINQLEAKFEATQKATSWLKGQLGDLRKQVEDSEKAVEVYRTRYGLGKMASGGGILDEQLSEINSQLIIARSERAGAEARLRQINRLLKSGADIETAGDVISSSMVQSLRQQEANLTRKASEMSVEFGVKHPKMIRINAEIANLKNKIESEIKNVIGSLKNEVEVARSREYSLRKSLKDLETKTGSNRKEEVQLRTLQREADANKVLFEQFLSRFKETTSTQGMQQADARIISGAEVPGGPSYPNTRKMYLMAIALALFLAAATVYILEMLHPGLRTPEQVEKLSGLPTLGLIPLLETGFNPYEYVLDKPHSSFAEALNTLRVSVALSDPDKALKVIQISSSVPEEGKSILAVCMDRGAAKAGHKVVVVDADLRRPALAKILQCPLDAKGLTDLVIAKDGNINDFMIKDVKSGMYVMPSGGAEFTSPVDIFSSKRMAAIVEALRDEFDLVIFDTPPVMAVSDARALSSQVDKTVFAVRWDNTPRKVIKAALKQLIDAQDNVAGVVLQKVDLKQYSTYGYGNSGYFYHYGKYRQYYTS